MSELTEGGEDTAQPSDQGSQPAPQRSGGGGGKFAQELHSESIHARQRTFYIDLKESGNGKFFKISEKSRGGQKSTIMFDEEDLDEFIAALERMRAHL